MFNCVLCGKTSQSGEQPARIVLETRAKAYPKRYNVNRGVSGNDDSYNDPGGQGTEIVREINVHEACLLEAQEEALG